MATVSHVSPTSYAGMCGCGAMGPRRSTRADAISAWNRRAPATVTRDKICEHIFHRVMAVDEFGNVNVWLTPDNADQCIKEAADAILALLNRETKL